MARPEVTGRKADGNTGSARRRPQPRAPPSDFDCLSIDEFCARNSISRQLFYKMKEQMPLSFCIGTRRLITREAADRWRREREKESA